MIASMYKRRMKVALCISAVIVVIGIILFFIDRPQSNEAWLTLISIGLLALFMIIFAISSHYKYQRVKDISIPQSTSSILKLDHLVLKKDVSFFPRLLLFEKNGLYVGTVKPIRIPFLYYPLNVLLRDTLIMTVPMTYGIYTNDDKVLVTFERKGIKKSTVSIKNAQGEQLGEYVQEDLRSIINIKGTLKDDSGNRLLPIKIKGFSGDFTLLDAQGQRWAHFYNGYFPHEYTKLFHDMQNDIVELASDLNEKHKLILIATISFLFLVRNK